MSSPAQPIRVPQPLAPDRTAGVVMSRKACEEWRARHGGTAAAAGQQLRALLAAVVSDGRAHRTHTGHIVLSRDGASLCLTPDLSTVTHYRARTVPQAPGVPPYLARSKPPAWLRRLVDEAPPGPARTSATFLLLLAKHSCGERLRRHTAVHWLGQATARMPAVLAGWDGAAGCHQLPEPGTGLVWMLMHRPETEERGPVFLSCFTPGSAARP